MLGKTLRRQGSIDKCTRCDTPRNLLKFKEARSRRPRSLRSHEALQVEGVSRRQFEFSLFTRLARPGSCICWLCKLDPGGRVTVLVLASCPIVEI